MARILARDPQTTKPPPAKRPAKFHGDGKHRATDVPYATEVGKADATRLDATANPLPDDLRADVNAKLDWFQGAAYDAYVEQVKPALGRATAPETEMPEEKLVQPLSPVARGALERQADDWYGVAQKLKDSRLIAWEKNARIPEAKPSIDVMEIVISIVAEGFGGVVYGLLEKMLADRTGHLLQEFVGLAGLEAGDLGAEAAMHKAAKSVEQDVKLAVKDISAEKVVAESVKGALKKGNDPLSFYVEAVRNHTIAEEAAEHKRFNTESPQMSDADVAAKSAMLEMTFKRLREDPDSYQQELTVGFMRMLDEARMEERAKSFGGNRDLAYYSDPSWSELHPGEVALSPTEAKDPTVHHSTVHFVGPWDNPDLSFDGFEAVAGAINKENLENLVGAEAKDLRLTMHFHLWAENPYSGAWETDTFDIMFRRDQGGRIVLLDRKHNKEWLTSYYTGEGRDHTSEERDKYAPLGAEKLYQALKSKTVKKTRVVDLYDLP